MAGHEIREAAIAAIDEEQHYWRSIINQIDIERVTGQRLAGDWDFRDLTAHLLAWREHGLVKLEAEARGETPPPAPWPAGLDDDDAINAWLHERDLNREAGELADSFTGSFDRLRKFVSRLSDDELVDPDRFQLLDGEAIAPLLVDGTFFEHLHDEHGPDIEALLRVNVAVS